MSLEGDGMTEVEWLTCTDPDKMLEFLRGEASARKMRLFAVACCRRVWNLLNDKRDQKAVEWSEQFADGRIDKEELSAVQKQVENEWWRSAMRHRWALPDEEQKVRHAVEAVKFVASATGRANELFHKMRWAANVSMGAELLDQRTSSQPRLQRCHLLREIFGNPSRSVSIAPAVLNWNYATVVRLAEVAYDERLMPAGTLNNDRLSVLSDALEESSCTDKGILGHLRGPGPHVRGCWVIDLLLGKS
jgi:hypothetical protein